MPWIPFPCYFFPFTFYSWQAASISYPHSLLYPTQVSSFCLVFLTTPDCLDWLIIFQHAYRKQEWYGNDDKKNVNCNIKMKAISSPPRGWNKEHRIEHSSNSAVEQGTCRTRHLALAVGKQGLNYRLCGVDSYYILNLERKVEQNRELITQIKQTYTQIYGIVHRSTKIAKRNGRVLNLCIKINYNDCV